MEKNNTQKGIVQFAMEAGAYMGLYFVVKFIFAVLSLNYPFCNVVSTIMLLFVPLVVFFMMRKFSNQNEGGSYFSQLWMMGILLFCLAYQWFGTVYLLCLYQSRIYKISAFGCCNFVGIIKYDK